MLKKTILIENPCFLNVTNDLFQITNKLSNESDTMPFDDIGYIIIENVQTTATLHFFQKSAENNVVIAFCDRTHTPISLALPLYSHTTQTQTLNNQIEINKTLKNNLWKQLIQAKIYNQSRLLKKLGKEYLQLEKLAKKITIETTNTSEATASRFYWRRLFDSTSFRRNPDGDPPNNLLNYGYAVLRAATARAIISSGLLPQISFKHHNKYDPLPLADDVMEAYRPYVDEVVFELYKAGDFYFLHKENKENLLKVLVCDTKIGTVKRPLMIALTYTAASIAKVINKKANYLALPKLE